MIGIIDYGLGNIKAFANVYKNLNIEYCIISKPEHFINVSHLILPGVGAFDHAMTRLNNSGLKSELDKQVLINKKPILGICVGMQMLAKSSEEGKLPGLGWIDGKVRKFKSDTISHRTKFPHMGWNTVFKDGDSKLLLDIEDGARYYFLHSYYFDSTMQQNIIAKTNYGIKFCSIVNSENIYGVQCHPEKSHSNGIQLLNNFSNI